MKTVGQSLAHFAFFIFLACCRAVAPCNNKNCHLSITILSAVSVESRIRWKVQLSLPTIGIGLFLSDSKSPDLPYGFIIHIRSVSILWAMIQESRMHLMALQQTLASWGMNREVVGALSTCILIYTYEFWLMFFESLISLWIKPLTKLTHQMSLPIVNQIVSLNPSSVQCLF